MWSLHVQMTRTNNTTGQHAISASADKDYVKDMGLPLVLARMPAWTLCVNLGVHSTRHVYYSIVQYHAMLLIPYSGNFISLIADIQVCQVWKSFSFWLMHDQHLARPADFAFCTYSAFPCLSCLGHPVPCSHLVVADNWDGCSQLWLFIGQGQTELVTHSAQKAPAKVRIHVDRYLQLLLVMTDPAQAVKQGCYEKQSTTTLPKLTLARKKQLQVLISSLYNVMAESSGGHPIVKEEQM